MDYEEYDRIMDILEFTHKEKLELLLMQHSITHNVYSNVFAKNNKLIGGPCFSSQIITLYINVMIYS